MLEDWTPFLVFMGVFFTGLFSYMGVKRSSKAAESAAELNNAQELIAEYRTLKDEIKKELNDKIIEVETRLNARFDEVLSYFAQYVKWVEGGAKPPAPFIPHWIMDRIHSMLSKEGIK